ncbi:transcription termination/antitermination protein NusG [Roseivivax sp. CAU 1753]
MSDPSDDTAAGNWFAAQLKPNGLGIAERNLTRQGFAHFMPKRLENVRRGDKMLNQARPLFPGYIFVRFDPASSQWRALNATRGLTRIIVNDPRNPRPLPEDFIAGMRARCDSDGLMTTAPAFQEGDRVRVVSGPMAELVSRIEQLESEDRVQLLTAFMGQETRVSVATHFLEKLAD